MILQGVPGSWLQNLAAWVLQASRQHSKAAFVKILMHNTRVQSYKIGGEVIRSAAVASKTEESALTALKSFAKMQAYRESVTANP